MNLNAVKTSAGFGLLFLLVYCPANYLTAHRAHVGNFHFEFERRIPFVPLMMLPYISVDLFFMAGPFFCRDDAQRRVLTQRIALAMVTAGVCFLLFPLRFSFGRPAVHGPLGWVFDSFRTMDLPFNQFPSLHIATLMILIPVYLARFPRLRWLIWIWSTLIAVSTVLTYQHHVIDLLGGFCLAVICFYLVPDPEFDCLRSLANRRIGCRYFTGGVVLTVLSVLLRPAGLILLWPAFSLGAASAGYAGLGGAIFRKHNGMLPWTTRMLLWPILLGQRLTITFYRHRCSAWDRLTDRLWIGRKLTNREAGDAVANGVTAVLDLTGEFSEVAAFRRIEYRQLPILDLTAPSADQLKQAIEFLSSATGILYIHCKIGYSRTAAVAGAYLLATGQAQTPESAIAKIRAARPSIVIRPEALQSIRNWFNANKGAAQD